MFEQMTGNGPALALQRIDDAGEVDGIPVNDRADHEIEAGGAKGLAVEGAVADLAALVKEDGALQLVGRFSLVETAEAAAPQLGIAIPFDHEAGAFETANLTQGSRQFAGPPRCGKFLQDRRGRDDALIHRRRHTQQFVPIVADEIDVDPWAEMSLQRRIGVWLLERMEFTIFEIAQAWREPPAKQGEQSKDMIARTASVGVMFVDVELRFVVEQAIKNAGRFALARAYRQDAEIAILVGEMAIEFRTGLAAVMEVHVASAGGAVAGAEE